MSYRFCLEVTKFHCTSLNSLRAMEESSVGTESTGGTPPVLIGLTFISQPDDKKIKMTYQNLSLLIDNLNYLLLKISLL